MKNINQYTEKAIEKLMELDGKHEKNINELKAMIGKRVAVMQGTVAIETILSEEDIQKQIEAANIEYTKKSEPMLEELMQKLSDSEKEAKQQYYAAEPVATVEQRLVASDIVKAYREDKNNVLSKEKSFMETLEEHIENQTVKALPYVFALKELEPEIDTEPYLIRISSDMSEAKNYLQNVEAAKTQFKLYQLRQEAKKLNLTNVERISIKRQFYELGGNPNTLAI